MGKLLYWLNSNLDRRFFCALRLFFYILCGEIIINKIGDFEAAFIFKKGSFFSYQKEKGEVNLLGCYRLNLNRRFTCFIIYGYASKRHNQND